MADMTNEEEAEDAGDIRERAMQAGMEGGIDAYNDAMGYEVGESPDFGDGRPDHDEDDEPDDSCSNPKGHSWVYTGTSYGGDDEQFHGEGRCYCEYCGIDGDA
jgi:hypothetical protein